MLCTTHDNFRGRLGSPLTKLLVQTIAECLLKRMVIRNYIQSNCLFLLIISVFVGISCFSAGLKTFVVQKQLALLFLNVY